jgi:hypothetical protein
MGCVETILDQDLCAACMKARAEKAERERDEARADTERLDWLQSAGVDVEYAGGEPWEDWTIVGQGTDGICVAARSLREAIDAARESGGEGE